MKNLLKKKTKKTAILAVTAITLVLSVFSLISCGGDDGGPIAGPPKPKGPNKDKTVTDPLVQLKSLKVVYTGDAKNLVEFTNPEQAFYEVSETDATKATIEVEAETSNTNAKITAKWYTGSQDDDTNNIEGGESEDPATNKVKLINVPVPDMPVDDDATVIVSKVLITVTFNGDDGEGNTVSKNAVFDLYIYPPKVDTTLKELQIKIDGTDIAEVLDSGTLHPAFSAKTTTYTMSKDGVPTGTAWSGREVTITAVANDPAAKVKMTLSPTDKTKPAQSTAPNGDPPSMTVTVAGAGLITKTIKIAVTNGVAADDPETEEDETSAGVTATYVITILPEQNIEGTVSSLQYVQFFYHDTTGKKKTDVAAANASFSPSVTRYTKWKPPAGYNSVYLKTVTPTSYYAQSPVVNVAGTGYAVTPQNPLGQPYNFVNNGESSPSVNPPVPIPSAPGEMITFTITGRATGLNNETAATAGTPPVGNNSSTPYEFSFAAAKQTDTFTGTAKFSDNSYEIGTSYPIKRIDHVELEYDTGSGENIIVRSSASDTIVTDTAETANVGKWTVEIDAELLTRLKSWAVIIQEETAKDTFTAYRASFPVTTSYTHTSTAHAGNDFTVNAATLSRIVYNAAGLAQLATHPEDNWFLNNDIDLSESGAWNGPLNFKGVFDGNGKTIYNMKLATVTANENGSNKSGLFNTLKGSAQIKNFTIWASTPVSSNGTPIPLQMECHTYFGGVVGFITGAVDDIVISNVTINGNLHYGQMKNNNNFLIIGGIMAQSDQTSGTLTIDHCVSNLNVTANLGNASNSSGDVQFAAGGLMGNFYRGNLTIKNSYSTGNIEITSSAPRRFHAGSLLGSMSFNSAPHTYSIQNCYASGTVKSGYAANTMQTTGGGLVGGVNGLVAGTAEIKNSAALGNLVLVSAASSTNPTSPTRGRLIGSVQYNTTSTNTATKVTLTNNIANADMYIGATSPGAKLTSGTGATTVHGADVNLSTGHATILSTLNNGYTNPVWEYKDGASLPSLIP